MVEVRFDSRNLDDEQYPRFKDNYVRSGAKILPQNQIVKNISNFDSSKKYTDKASPPHIQGKASSSIFDTNDPSTTISEAVLA